MSQKTYKTLGVRVPQDFYDRVKNHAKSHNLSLSDFLRQAVEKTMSNHEDEVLQTLREALHQAHQQLQTKDEQIQRLHQLLAISQANLSQIQQQKSLWTRIQRHLSLKKGRSSTPE